MNERDSPCANVVNTSDLVRCLANAKDVAEAQLKTLYKRVGATLNTAEVQQLIRTQYLWTRYRDANCIAERDLYRTGTASDPAYFACLEAMTRKRTQELTITYAVRLK